MILNVILIFHITSFHMNMTLIKNKATSWPIYLVRRPIWWPLLASLKFEPCGALPRRGPSGLAWDAVSLTLMVGYVKKGILNPQSHQQYPGDDIGCMILYMIS
jgi:hypothetical protein